ncbi:MAG: DUF4373 domain-containing protein [Syntrophomonadaceae bacterium]|nr:DUF4373 domain-containing protein [Syntrophomonadaceae bacterium]
MARPQKEGLEYFPLNTDIDQDDKLQLIEAKFGIKGFGIVIKLLMKIYREGYYYEWSEKEQLLFSKRVNVDINEVNDVINECLKWDLFDQDTYDTYGILTSRGIQRRYFEAVGRRKEVEVVTEYCLIDLKNQPHIVYVNINPVNVHNNPLSNRVNADINSQSKVKESKEKNTTVTPPDVDINPAEFNPAQIEEGLRSSRHVIESFEKEFGRLLGPFEVEETQVLVKEYGDELVLLALKESITRGIRTLKYIRGILTNWGGLGIKSVQDAEEHERQFREQKQKQQQKVADVDKAKKSSLGSGYEIYVPPGVPNTG